MEIYQVKIALRNTRPRIWRRVLVPRDFTLGKLHRVLQRAMGWTDSHLHRFVYGRGRHFDLRFALPSKVTAENKTKLGDVLTAPGDRLLYEYDFGDGWQHDVLLEQVLLRQDSFQPVCVAGERACPPEDVEVPTALLSFSQKSPMAITHGPLVFQQLQGSPWGLRITEAETLMLSVQLGLERTTGRVMGVYVGATQDSSSRSLDSAQRRPVRTRTPSGSLGFKPGVADRTFFPVRRRFDAVPQRLLAALWGSG